MRHVADGQRQRVVTHLFAERHTEMQAMLDERGQLLSLSATVGKALAGNDSLSAILQRCAEALIQYLDVTSACIWTLNAETERLHIQANAGRYTPIGDLHGDFRVGEAPIGTIARDRRPYVTDQVHHEAWATAGAWAERTGVSTFAGYPLMVEDRLVGVMAMFAKRPFSPATQKALAWMSHVIAMGIDRIWMSDALARSIANVVRMNKKLRRQNAALDEFTHIASHDLQEPLRQLISFSRMLRQDLGAALPERAETDLGYIIDAAARLRLLIQNLLALSRTGNAVMQYEPVDLDDCVNRAIDTLAEEVATTQATITRDALPRVQGDPGILGQVYYHLLRNALMFRGDRHPNIHLSVERHDERLVLGVRDNGIGIKPEYHDHIFAPFKRLHGRAEFPGIGMGLAICQKAIERHGGRLWVESQANQGAHFKFTLAQPTES